MLEGACQDGVDTPFDKFKEGGSLSLLTTKSCWGLPSTQCASFLDQHEVFGSAIVIDTGLVLTQCRKIMNTPLDWLSASVVIYPPLHPLPTL